jgi:hypothetical protein
VTVVEDDGSIQLHSREDVAKFLEGKPAEWAELLAARTSLRALPLLCSLFSKSVRKQPGRQPGDMFLILLRASILSWLAALVPSDSATLRSARLKAHEAAQAAAAASYSADAYAPARAAAAAAEADAAYAVYAAATAANSDRTMFEAFSRDAAHLARFWRIDSLHGVSLWNGTAVPPNIATAWNEITQALRESKGASDWKYVWVDWYEAVLEGRAPWGLSPEMGEQIMVQSMLWPQREWDKGPLHVNRRVAELISEERQKELPSDEKLPQQERLAHRFNGLASEPIDLALSDDASDRLQAGSHRQEDYADIRAKAEDLESLGPNRLGHLATALERLRSLPSAVADTRAQSFWSVANTLRIKLAGHQAAEDHHKGNHARPEYEKDERLLEALVGDGLKDLVQTINAFVLGDPSLMDRDAARPGPQETQLARREAELIAPIVADVSREPDVATRDASETVADELAKAATTGSSLAERQGAEAGRRSLRNFVAALLQRAYVPIKKAGPGAAEEAAFAWKEMRSGFYKKAGEATLIASAAGIIWLTGRWAVIAEFVAHHAAALSAYAASAFPNNPVVLRIIEAIAKVFGL